MMDELYGQRCDRCGGFTNAADQKITFSPEALTKGLEEIFKGMNVRDEIQQDIFHETLRLFNLAAAKGISEAYDEEAITDEFLEQIRHNNEVFSAFRTHRMQNDIAKQLLDEKGQLKPFYKFKKDVEPLTGKYCDQWLNTEYNTAVIRAHRAAEWKHFETEKDVYPNLRWMPTTSVNPDPVHESFWSHKLTLPIDDPFWSHHQPGERWNCKCSCEQTDEPVNDLGMNEEIRKDTANTGLHGNPAETGKLFSEDHPYYTESYPGAKKAVENMDYVVNNRQQLKVLDGNYELTKTVVDTEEKIRTNKDAETSVVFNKNGEILVDKRGQSTSVSFTDDEVKLMKNAILTHNHPRGWKHDEKDMQRIGNSFSKADIGLAIHADLAEIRAVTPNYTFSLKRPEKGWNISIEKFDEIYKKLDKELYNENVKNINLDYVSPKQANTTHYHVLTRKIAKQLGWIYEKKRTK